MKNLTSSMKTILVFEDNELIKQISFKTKNDAKRNFNNFIKNGMLDPLTGEVMKNLTFELL